MSVPKKKLRIVVDVGGVNGFGGTSSNTYPDGG